MTHNERLRALLREQRDETQARVAKFEADLDALLRDRRSDSADDEHDPEGTPLSFQWSMLSGLLEGAREDAAQAEHAIQRLDDGRYGICTSCGQPIPVAQLEVRPFRERCVACSE